MKGYLNIISSIIMLTAAAVAFYFFYLALFPVTATKITNIAIEPTTANPGQMMYIKANFCRNSPIVARLVRTVETVSGSNDVVVPYPVFTLTAPTGCGKFELDTVLPKDLTPGVYEMNLTLEYQANPIRTISQDFYSKPFKVVK